MNRAKDIRLLLSDVDGTLVNQDKMLTPGAIAAAKALRDAGIGLAVTSSRPPFGMGMLVEPLGLKLPIAGCNGGVLVNPDLTVIETNLIDAAAARKVVDFLRQMKVDVWLYTETEWVVPDSKGAHVEREAWIVKTDPVVASSFSAAQLAHAVKVVGVSQDFDRIAECETRAQALFGDTVSATRSANYFLDVTNPKANKGGVVDTLARRLNISTDQIATIGDMPNDVLMFARSGFSIAMGNASDAVKAQAKAVTTSNQEDGWAHAVRTFILPAGAA
ncbi:Cof-type HAD-IIB family hydrolase [Caulobacter sp. S45]|uniref:Cof-type HAD-IIB family hydrolase n=1 Tax=Caulobacter sp. S45 TaxID=1641861 RepID=UPI00131CDFA6|nr:Cof-type HAD-IIB family hydrolase [Caulobacter sp. S45]